MILVTGGLGMIKAQTARALTDLGHGVVVIAHGRTTPPPFLDGRVAVERVDVTDRAVVLALGDRYRSSDIVHLAGSVPGDDPSRSSAPTSAAPSPGSGRGCRGGTRSSACSSAVRADGVPAGKPRS